MHIYCSFVCTFIYNYYYAVSGNTGKIYVAMHYRLMQLFFLL